MNKRFALLHILVALGLSNAANAGVTVTMIHKDGKEPSEITVEGNKMRIDSGRGRQEAGHSVMIFDGDAQKMIMVDQEKKTYTEVTRAQLKAFTSEAQRQMQDSMAKLTPEQRQKMDQMMAQMNPEQRKRMQDMMGQKGGAAPESKKNDAPQRKWETTGSRTTVAGYPCEGFKELRDGKLHGEGCYIPWSAGAITKADFAPMRSLGDFLSEAGIGGKSAVQKEFLELEKLPGFPGVWAEISEDGKKEPKSTVTSIKRGSISGDKFQPPAGYTKSEKVPWGK